MVGMERELHLGTRRLRRCPAPVPGSTWRASWPVWCAVLCRRRSARAAATRPASRGTQSSSTRGGRSSWASLRWSAVPPTGRDDLVHIFGSQRKKLIWDPCVDDSSSRIWFSLNLPLDTFWFWKDFIMWKIDFLLRACASYDDLLCMALKGVFFPLHQANKAPNNSRSLSS